MLKDQVLYTLEQNRGDIVTGGELARRLGVSRTAVWKAIHALQEEGNEIRSVPNSGYKLMEFSDNLLEQSIRDNLRTEFIGKQIKILQTTPSTNQYLKGMDVQVAEEGLTVIADEQTGGRGRRGRQFLSPAREGIYLSMLLKPSMLPRDTQFLTICAALAVSEAIEAVCEVQTEIKWVNDIYCKGKKLCGILTEAFVSVESQTVEYAVVGIGINTGEVAREVRGIATSIRDAGGGRGIRNRLIGEVLNRFEAVYLDYIAHGKKLEILDAYTKRLFILSHQVVIADGDYEFTATVLGIDDDGALIIRDADGEIRHITTGEIKRW